MTYSGKRINLDEPRWDQNTYWGRAKHFFVTTNPLNLLCTSEELDRSKDIVTRYKRGENIPNLSEDELWRAKNIYDSAFHPETGEKVFLIGRMSAQVPMNMIITGCMLTFYKSRPEVIFWQFLNQSFNAVVNYSNRSGESPVTVPRLATSTSLAVTGAVVTALSLNNLAKKAPPLIGRWVPFVAIAAANCVNIPIIRMKEIQEGIMVTGEDGTKYGHSTNTARVGISEVVVSRIGMAVPGMVLSPIVMDRLERRGVFTRYPMLPAPLQVLLAGFCLTFTVPLCCALFAQKASIKVSNLEPELQERIKKSHNPPTIVYYNKGL